MHGREHGWNMEGWREGTALAVGSCGGRLSARSQTGWLVAVFTLSTFSCAPISLLFPLLLSSLRTLRYSLSPSRPSFIRCAHYRARRRCRRGAALPPRHAPRTLNYGMAKPRSTHPPCVCARAGRILNGLFQRLTPRDEDEEVPKCGRKSGRRMGS